MHSSVSCRDEFVGASARPGLHSQDAVETWAGQAFVLANDGYTNPDDVKPLQATCEEGSDGLLAGHVENDRVGVRGRRDVAGQVDGGEGDVVQRLGDPVNWFAPIVGSHQA